MKKGKNLDRFYQALFHHQTKQNDVADLTEVLKHFSTKFRVLNDVLQLRIVKL